MCNMETRGQRRGAERILDSTFEQRVLGGDQTQLGRPLRAPEWLVPHVELRTMPLSGSEPEPCLVWRFRNLEPVSATRPAQAVKGALDAELRDGSDKAILEFAQEWGVIEHGLKEEGLAPALRPTKPQWSVRLVGRTRPADEAKGALDAFLKLKDVPDKAILKFAQEWGVLGLCEHREPFTHNHRIDIVTAPIEPKPCFPAKLSPGVYFEPVAAWRPFIDEASKIVRGVAQLRTVPLSKVAPNRREGERVNRRRAWNRAYGYTQQWIARSAARWAVYDFPPAGESASGERVMENPRRLQLTADLPMLYDVLAFQLALAITCSEGLLVCAACNQPFVRASKPVPGRRVFCRSCGHRAAVRLWTRKRRALEKKEKKR